MLTLRPTPDHSSTVYGWFVPQASGIKLDIYVVPVFIFSFIYLFIVIVGFRLVLFAWFLCIVEISVHYLS